MMQVRRFPPPSSRGSCISGFLHEDNTKGCKPGSVPEKNGFLKEIKAMLHISPPNKPNPNIKENKHNRFVLRTFPLTAQFCAH